MTKRKYVRMKFQNEKKEPKGHLSSRFSDYLFRVGLPLLVHLAVIALAPYISTYVIVDMNEHLKKINFRLDELHRKLENGAQYSSENIFLMQPFQFVRAYGFPCVIAYCFVIIVIRFKKFKKRQNVHPNVDSNANNLEKLKQICNDVDNNINDLKVLLNEHIPNLTEQLERIESLKNSIFRELVKQTNNTEDEDNLEGQDDSNLESQIEDNLEAENENNQHLQRIEPLQISILKAKNYQQLIDLDNTSIVLNEEEFECLICFGDVEPGEGIVLRECLHTFCRGCVGHTVKYSETVEVHCPFRDENYACPAVLQEREIKAQDDSNLESQIEADLEAEDESNTSTISTSSTSSRTSSNFKL